MDIEELLHVMVERGASDLHVRVPSPPVLRIDGSLQILEDLPRVTPQYVKECLENLTTETQRERFYNELEIDLAYSVAGLARFRVAAYFQRGTISIAIRQVSLKVPTIDELGLPSVSKTLAMRTRGLVLVTGPTGAGKSTTLAAMIDHLNRTERRNVITIEDPIEYVYHNEKCIIAQRDLGDDFTSFSVALRHTLRQDPDVILVGEMRDLDTIATAITAAETGHLVLSTVHTVSAPQTIDRIVDVFPAHQQEQIRFQVSMVLEGVLSQHLMPRAGGKGRVAAFEIMVSTDAIRNLIRDGRTDQIPTYLQTGRQSGMQTMDQALEELVKSGMVTVEEAMMRANKPEEFRRMYTGS
ncbi:MAG: type IV pilus twitching motility protein PilT [Dehalococcoidia bacterium]|nr:MAG: type IV pilus twitching motility protein PilT [Dehalococcoidia bacterium]